MTETAVDISALVDLALTGDKTERKTSEKAFERLCKGNEVTPGVVNSLCLRLFGQQDDSSASDDSDVEEEDSEEEEEEDGDEDDLQMASVADQSVLAGHNEDIVLDDLNESSFSLLEVLLQEDEELVGQKKNQQNTKSAENKKLQLETRTTQLRIVKLLEQALASSAVYEDSQLVVDWGCSLLTFALDSSDEEVSQKLISLLDSVWRKKAVSPTREAAAPVDREELGRTLKEDLLSLIANHKSLTPAAVRVVSRVFGKLLQFLSPSEEEQMVVVKEVLMLWMRNKVFRRSQGLPFFQTLLLKETGETEGVKPGIWIEAVENAAKVFRLKELATELIPWKNIQRYADVMEIAESTLTKIESLGGEEFKKDKANVALGKEIIKVLVNKHPKNEKGLLGRSLKSRLETSWSDSCSQLCKNLMALDTERAEEPRKRKSEEKKEEKPKKKQKKDV